MSEFGSSYRYAARHVAGACLALVGAICWGLVGCKPAAQPAAPLTMVTVSPPFKRQVTRFEEFLGKTEAVDKVEIRARVSGYLDKIYFTSGKEVAKDAPLFLIDPRPYQAEYDRLKAQVTLNEARSQQAKADLARAEKLAPTKAISQQDYDKYIANAAEADASVKAAQANLEQASLNLEFTHVNAPVAGRVSRNLLTEGNLVQADQTLLTTLVSVDPIYAYFDVDEQTLLFVRDLIQQGKAKSANDATIHVRMALANDEGFPHRGTINFIDNRVNPSTGALQIRAVFENPLVSGDIREFTPGLAARVRVPIGEPHSALMVPERAIGTDQGQKFVYVIEQHDGKPKVAARSVKLGILNEGWREILSGITAKDRIIVSGLQRVRPGKEVEARPASFSAEELPKNMTLDGGEPTDSEAAPTASPTTAPVEAPASDPPAKTEPAKSEAPAAEPAKAEPAPKEAAPANPPAKAGPAPK